MGFGTLGELLELSPDFLCLRGAPMRKVDDYKKHAEECRTMARNTVNEEHRQGLLQMAETWESLAEDRIAQIARQRRIGELDQSAGGK